MKKWALHPYRSRTSATYWRALIPPSSNVSMKGDPAGGGSTSRTVRGRPATAAWRAAMWPSNSSQSSLYLPACGPGKPLASDSPFFTTSWYSKDTALITYPLSPCFSRAGTCSTVRALDQGRHVLDSGDPRILADGVHPPRHRAVAGVLHRRFDLLDKLPRGGSDPDEAFVGLHLRQGRRDDRQPCRQVFAQLDRIDAGGEPVDLERQDGRRESLRESGQRPVRSAT